jgi:TRAP-type C4-dicarboxylate transport system substrate-binding protein
MREMTTRSLAPALLAGLLSAVAAGCGPHGGGDKAGGSRAPTVLRLAVAYGADQPDAPLVREFASRVAGLSGGSLRMRVVFAAPGRQTAAPEARVAQMVRDGEFELGWIGARAWDRVGVTSFQALQAPFLVTDLGLLGRIATGPLAARMLAGLDGHGFVGLALVPDRLRYPMGVRHPLASPDDFAGARVRVIPSRATEALMRALGATPVHVSGDEVGVAVANGKFDGTEASLGSDSAREGDNFLTANVPLFAKALTLFASRTAYVRLDDHQRAVLRKAAEQTVAQVAAHPPSESRLVRRFCTGGRPVTAVTASRADVLALMRAAQPVYAELERDPQTRALIAAIRELKAKTPAAPTTAPPRGCAQDAPSTAGRELSPSALNGTYRMRLTKAGAVASGVPRDEDIGNVQTQTLRDGRWLGGETKGGAAGTYKIIGDRIVFEWPEEASSNTFTFIRHPNGDLDLEPVLPMDRGDQFNWASARWRRIGPPVREIP